MLTRVRGKVLGARRRWWMREGRRLAAETDLSRFEFHADGVWLRDERGALWAHHTHVLAYGVELGVVWEPGEIDALISHLAEGGTFVDVGAAIGAFTVAVARATPGGVHAFEPVNGVREVLLRNLAKNGLIDRVTVSHLALSDRRGAESITTTDSGGNHLVSDGHADSIRNDLQSIVTITLDEYVSDTAIEKVDAIKIDVEGLELRVLHGARELLLRDHPLVLVEIEQRWCQRYGLDARDVFAYLHDLGYDYERVAGHALVKAAADPVEDMAHGNNFVFRAR